MLTIAAVVPMFNEESSIEATLDALLRQTRPFDEIIIVDNASTDQSAEIVEKITVEHPVVRLITETRPGCYAARATGYDAATSDVIARTDADCIPDVNWARTIGDFFGSETGADYAATTGPISMLDGPPFAFIEKMTHGVAEGQETVAVSGPNHAIRRSAWVQIRGTLTARQDVWEDFDISLALSEVGERMWFEPAQQVATSARTQRKSPIANWNYLRGGVRTAKARGNKAATRRMRVDMPIRFLLMTGSWVIFRPWDEATQTWKLRRLFQHIEGEHADVTKGR